MFSKYLNFCLDFSFMQENDLIWRNRLASEFIVSQPGYQTVAIQVLSNVSRSKGNETMKFGQLKSLTSEILFFKNHTQNVVEKPFWDPFLKNQNWAYLRVNSLKYIQFVFIVCQVESYRNILKLSCRPLALTPHKTF